MEPSKKEQPAQTPPHCLSFHPVVYPHRVSPQPPMGTGVSPIFHCAFDVSPRENESLPGYGHTDGYGEHGRAPYPPIQSTYTPPSITVTHSYPAPLQSAHNVYAQAVPGSYTNQQNATFGSQPIYSQNVPATLPAFEQQRHEQANLAPPRERKRDSPSSIESGRAQGFLFDSLAEAKASFPAPDWRCPADDPTIPTTDHDRRQWVQKLVTAMNNLTDIYDTKGPSFQKRWPTTGNSTHYTSQGKEIVCWNILLLAEKMHRAGPGVLFSFLPRFWDNAEKTRAWTFQQRVGEIIELLARSKGRCETLMGNESLQSVVAFPSHLRVAAKRNRQVNGCKRAMLEAARSAKRVESGGEGG